MKKKKKAASKKAAGALSGSGAHSVASPTDACQVAHLAEQPLAATPPASIVIQAAFPTSLQAAHRRRKPGASPLPPPPPQLQAPPSAA